MGISSWMSRSLIFVFGIVLIGSLFTCSVVAKKESVKLETVIGIDLGTTYSCVGVYKNHKVEIVANDQGNRTTPSWVGFIDGERLIGEAAKNQAAANSERTIFDVKRLIGRQFDDKDVQRDRKLVPYNIVNKDGKPYIQVKVKDGETKVFSPEEISAMVLTKMKETAEAFLGEKVKNAVITVPVYFNDAQRQATKDAGTIAGLNVVRIINEPTAAAIAYGLDRKGSKKNILVFDLGGGTFDVSILKNIDNGVLEVLATSGDTHLGGEDFDQRIMEYFIKLINKKYKKDISKDNRALDKLRKEAERSKRALSNQHGVRVKIESLFDGVDFSEPLTRAGFEELNSDLFRKTMGPVKKAMQDANLEKDQIDEIVLVGGSTRIPKVQQLLRDYFNGKELSKGLNPEEAVAFGATVQAGILSGEGGDNTKHISISNDQGHLSQEEIERMVQEAVKFAEEEKKAREIIQARIQLETYINNMKNQINDKDKLSDKLESNEKEKFEEAVKEAHEWLDEYHDVEKEDYDEKLKEVEAVCNPIITAVYQRSGAGTTAEDDDDSHDEL